MDWEQVLLPVLSPSVLLGFAIWMLFTGRLWTNAAYQQKIKECEKWEKAYEASEAARALAYAQTTELLEFAKTDHNLLVALFEVSERARQPGGTHVVSTTTTGK